MKNIDAIIEKLMLNRSALLIKRFDAELKEILDSDIKAFHASQMSNIRNSSNNQRGSVRAA